jgi:hypothetical protein
MYCAKCGTLVNDALNYCNSCGAKLNKSEENETPESILSNLLTTLCFVALGGLGILIGLTAVLLKNGVDHKGVILLAGFYLSVLFGLCYLILSQVPKLIDAKLNKKTEASANDFVPPAQISARNTAQLEEHREPVMSVTDSTTRTFDKIPLKEN